MNIDGDPEDLADDVDDYAGGVYEPPGDLGAALRNLARLAASVAAVGDDAQHDIRNALSDQQVTIGEHASQISDLQAGLVGRLRWRAT